LTLVIFGFKTLTTRNTWHRGAFWRTCAAERVFSVLKRLLGETRSQTLADMVEGSLLLNFNNAKRRSEKEAGFW